MSDQSTTDGHALPLLARLKSDWLALLAMLALVAITRGIWLGDPVAEYPEWDHRAGRYRPGWTQVHEIVPRGASTGADTSNDLTRHLLLPCRRQKPAFGLGPKRHA